MIMISAGVPGVGSLQAGLTRETGRDKKSRETESAKDSASRV